MKLMEAIIDANHRALAGDAKAGLHPSEYAAELPMVALSCIDVRLNSLLPEVLGLPKEEFIWLRNAGNIITGPLSSTMRSLSLACAIKGGMQVVIIGHTQCQVGRTTTAQLIERFRAQGIDRRHLPDNLSDYFGTFASERQNVIKAAEIVRGSPLIGPKVAVHGLIVDVETGRLEWLVNGYQAMELVSSQWNQLPTPADILNSLPDFQIGDIKFAEVKIGELATPTTDWLSSEAPTPEPRPAPPQPAPFKPPTIKPLSPVPPPPQASGPPPPLPPRIPLPPPQRPKMQFRKGWK